MKVLVTAGNTAVPIDKVRSITNIFKGRTGTKIADYFAKQGDMVTLLASTPDIVPAFARLHLVRFLTFDDLYKKMQELITNENYDVVIHSAAVSDYKVDGVFVKGEGGQLFRLDSSGKLSSTHEELYLRMVQTPKIVDQVREPWEFKGTLVKFKLLVGVSDDELIEVATESMHHSRADFIVANTTDRLQYTFLIGRNMPEPIKIGRLELPVVLRGRILR